MLVHMGVSPRRGQGPERAHQTNNKRLTGYAGTWEMRAGIRLERGRGVDEIEGVRAQKVDAQRRGDCALLEARSVVGCDARGGSSRAMGIGGVRPLN
jgi:hypothetical protein